MINQLHLIDNYYCKKWLTKRTCNSHWTHLLSIWLGGIPSPPIYPTMYESVALIPLSYKFN